MNEERRFENVKEFAQYVAEHLFDENSAMKENHHVEVKEVVKNNGLVLTGLIIKEDDVNIAPTLYMNQGYEMYLKGRDIESLIESYLCTYEESRLSNDFSVEFFMDFDKVKDRLMLKLINAASNVDMLTECPHLILGDLAVIFQVKIDTLAYGNATITVKKEHAKIWNVGTATLLTCAKLNMETRERFNIQPMMEVIAGMMGLTVDEAIEMGADIPMFVMSNESKINGATGLIFTEKLQSFAEMHDCNLIILPSSIHEILIVLDKGGMDIASLTEIVKAINTSEVSPEEVLSNSVYYYDRNAHELQMADTKEKIEIKIA